VLKFGVNIMSLEKEDTLYKHVGVDQGSGVGQAFSCVKDAELSCRDAEGKHTDV
jgi:hypothetical protein